MPSADVAICAQFLFVSVVLPPFNPGFTFPLWSEVPLYFVVALFSAYSQSASSHSLPISKSTMLLGLAWLTETHHMAAQPVKSESPWEAEPNPGKAEKRG